MQEGERTFLKKSSLPLLHLPLFQKTRKIGIGLTVSILIARSF